MAFSLNNKKTYMITAAADCASGLQLAKITHPPKAIDIAAQFYRWLLENTQFTSSSTYCSPGQQLTNLFCQTGYQQHTLPFPKPFRTKASMCFTKAAIAGSG